MYNLHSFRTIACSMLFVFVAGTLNAEKHFINDYSYRIKVIKQFEKQKTMAKSRQNELFDVFQQKLTLEEKEALTFLYAYMPLSDLADYKGAFFLKNTQTTLKIRDTFAWCEQIPEDIFRHFVLPVRVNNETLDTARIVFFAELKNRVNKLSMREAALEVNHWCHEKVIYKSTDGRTSSPLNCVRTAYGRCGEESTFAVTALRSVGIPARQCYTPRWAHCDDNHAWIEVWVDGKWSYMGACEPESDLNIGWFSEPSKRAMLVNTNVFGDYNGPEEVLEKTEYFTKINVLSNYATTKKVFVKIVDKAHQPIENATVEFCLYNYAEFYPLSTKKTNTLGLCSFVTGLGDLVIWANSNDNYGFKQLTVTKTDTLTLILGNNSAFQKAINFDLVPPVELKVDDQTSSAEKNKNATRLKMEDDIRSGYTKTFKDSVGASMIATKVGLNNDSVCSIFQRSCGNWSTIQQFLEENSNYNSWKLALLNTISNKDLRDIYYASLVDHLNNSFDYAATATRADFTNYVINPRIGIEMSSAYKKDFQKAFSPNFISQSRKNMQVLIDWIIKNIKIDNLANYYNVPISPIGVYKLRVTDENSRNIFFVAVCRSFGIPARIETATKQTQYFENGKWTNAIFEKNEILKSETGFIVLQNNTNNKDFAPVYSIHYSLAYLKNGKYHTLDYEEDENLRHFPCKLELPVGRYRLVSGNRKYDGSVLSSISFFDIKKNQTQNLSITLREMNEEVKLQGNIPMKSVLVLDGKNEQTIASLAQENGLVVLWVDPQKEPTKHLLVELQNAQSKIQNWGGKIAFVLPNEEVLNTFKPECMQDLPLQYISTLDTQQRLLKTLEATVQYTLQSKLPVLLYLSKNGDILFVSSGYAIGTVEQLLKATSKHTESLKSCVPK